MMLGLEKLCLLHPLSFLPVCVCGRACAHMSERNLIKYNINCNINHPCLCRDRKILETEVHVDQM